MADKRRILLMGKNDSLIDDFFAQMAKEYDMMTSSYRPGDLSTHIDIFEPELLVIGLNDEAYDDIAKLHSLKKKLETLHVVTIGTADECQSFEDVAGDLTDLIITRPIKIEGIRNKLEAYFDELDKKAREAEAERQKELEEAAKKSEEVLGRAAADRAEAEAANEPGRKHVLVIDDDTLMLKVIKEHLHGKYDVATAVSGKFAYKFLEKKHTDLILLDYEMPDENGPEVLRKLREEMGYKHIPVIFLTGVADKAKIAAVLSLKPQGYLLKPVDRTKLLEAVRKQVGE